MAQVVENEIQSPGFFESLHVLARSALRFPSKIHSLMLILEIAFPQSPLEQPHEPFCQTQSISCSLHDESSLSLPWINFHPV